MWYHLYNSKNVKNSHGVVLLLVKLQAKAALYNSNINIVYESIVLIQHILLAIMDLCQLPLREKCPYSEFFWSIFSRIWTEYGEILRSVLH